MASANLPVDDASKLHRLLRGLSNDWAHEKKHFELTKSSYETVCSALYELGEQQEHEKQLTLAFQTQTKPSHGRPEPSRGQYRGLRPLITCYTCGGSDHFYAKCPTGLQPTRGEDGRRRSRCFTCLKEGHISKDCPKKKIYPAKQALAVLHEAAVSPPTSLNVSGEEGS
jgi:hypothetical protein